MVPQPLMQLTVPLTPCLRNGAVVKVRALIDTGSQANLINEDLIPKGCLTWARDQLHLVAANGLKIPGGNYEVHTKTQLQKVTQQGFFMGLQDFEASFHVAQLSLDAILSYPWLAKKWAGGRTPKEFLHAATPRAIVPQTHRGRGMDNSHKACW